MAVGDFYEFGKDYDVDAGRLAELDPAGFAGSGTYGMSPLTVEDTFAGRPQDLWETARLQQMGARGMLPQWQRQRLQGFEPMLGEYFLSGRTTPFADYLTNRTAATDTTSSGPTAVANNWANAIAASRALAVKPQTWLPKPTVAPAPTAAELEADPAAAAAAAAAAPAMTPEQLVMQGYLTGEGARGRALAMAGTAMGGGVGVGAQARQAALGNLYDLYAARAAATGTSPGTFLSWLSGKVGTPSTT